MTRRLFASATLITLLVGSGPSAAADPEIADDGRSARIVGGTEADPGEYPFMVAIIGNPFDPSGSQFCGGALIDPSWVITAQHCTRGTGAGSMWVYANDHDLSGTGDVIAVNAKFEHPDFTASLKYDVTLLELASPAKTSRDPAELLAYATESDVDEFAEGATATVIGWGSTTQVIPPSWGRSFPDMLREVEVPMRSTTDCKAAYGGRFKTDVMICAGLDAGGKDSCQGDSGGPLIVDMSDGSGDPVWLHVGITSWGDGCAAPGLYGVYARTASFGDWIESTSGVLPGCEGYSVTLFGTDGDDNISGTSGDDVILAGAGADTIHGNDGNDVICGGDGADTIRGGHGDDIIFGGKGQDWIRGNHGQDEIYGEQGADDIHGGRAKDTIDGGPSDDEISGGQRNDFIDGQNGDDLISGHSGNDTIDGGAGNDTIYGNDGDDTLSGGADDDFIAGQGGADVIDGGSGTDEIKGGSESDTCTDGEVVSGC